MEKYVDTFIDFLPTLIKATIILVAGYFITKIFIKLLVKGISKTKVDKTLISFSKSLVKVALYTIIIVMVLTTFGIDTTSIIAVLGAAGLAVALALQSSMSNIAGGFIILFSNPFKVGDYIETGSVSGTVDEISILYTRLLTIDNKAIYIPNGQISSSTLINYTEEKTRRLDMIFSISYNDDFVKAKKIISNAISDNSLAIKEPEPVIRINEHGSNSINLIAKIWVNSEDYWNLKYDLLETIKLKFDQANISIPFNQLDITINK